VSIFFLTVLALIVSCPFNNFVFAYQPQERVFDKLLVLAKNQADLQNKKILKVQQPSVQNVAQQGRVHERKLFGQPVAKSDREKSEPETGEQVHE